MEVNKGLVQMNADVSRILDKVTEYAGYVSEVGASDQLDLINKLVTDTLEKKDIYVKSVREEVETRDLSEEKIKNALGLKIRLGYGHILLLLLRDDRNKITIFLRAFYDKINKNNTKHK